MKNYLSNNSAPFNLRVVKDADRDQSRLPVRSANEEYQVALAGNPNSGKSTIFNLLTGSRQRIGNYPGVTVEKKEGAYSYRKQNYKIVDLPGTYSLTAAASDEFIARQFLLNEKPDLVINIVDASTLERGLVLTAELIEMDLPLVLVLNMIDVAEEQGLTIDTQNLEKLLSIPVITTIGRRGLGKDKLLTAIAANSKNVATDYCRPGYNHHLELEIENLVALFQAPLPQNLPPRWLAVKLLEDDPRAIEMVEESCISGNRIANTARRAQQRLAKALNRDPALAVIEERYGFSSSLCRQVVTTSISKRVLLSEKIDLVMTNRLLGLPIFFLLMYLIFYLTFSCGAGPAEWISHGIGKLGLSVSRTFSDGPLRSLLINGILAGVGNVVTFMPNIFLLFFALALLEDSGYMARVAFLMDRVMKTFNLSGKSFIPMMIGLGCSVPAIMATRTLENEADHLTTIMVLPLMSCSARLPIYTLIIPAFFAPNLQAPILMGIYLTGFCLMMLTARFLRRHLMPEGGSPLIMELPPYRLPTLQGLFIHMWERGRLYLKKAGLIIFTLSIIFWALTSYPKAPVGELAQLPNPAERREAAISYSAAGRLGHALEPLLKPLGFDWRIGTALIGACAAKEMFVAQMGIVFTDSTSPDDAGATLGETLRRHYGPLTGLCIILFNLISLPCLATLAATRQETNSWRWPILQFVSLTLLAWLITFFVYQTGRMLSTLFGGA
ncbi:MAG: ferrous iron transport protein B [Deltaproteobacteria bacterium]|nr:ferrous iron transport protein B [Candidatus Tharpella aukensis]